MPGTVPRTFDPALTAAAAPAANAGVLAAAAPRTSAALDASLTALPAHPSAGVASTGAAHAVAAAAPSAALAQSNAAAQMTSRQATGGAAAELTAAGRRAQQARATEQAADAEHDKALKQFVETPGHFSLVRCVSSDGTCGEMWKNGSRLAEERPPMLRTSLGAAPLTAPMLTRLHSNFHLADAFTLMNGFCGAQSLFASARYLLTSDPKHAWTALWFPVFGAIFDLLDGKVARWRKSSSMLGQELDSLADSVRGRQRAVCRSWYS